MTAPTCPKCGRKMEERPFLRGAVIVYAWRCMACGARLEEADGGEIASENTSSQQ